jgi:hypothetical protein
MKRYVANGLMVLLMCVASASAFMEDFEDAGNLDGSLYGGATVGNGYLNGNYMSDGFLANGDFPDFTGHAAFNFGGDAYSWNVVNYTFGADGSHGTNGAVAGVMIWYLPYGGYTSPNGWMYVLQQLADPDGASWSTIYLDQSGAVNPPSGYDNTLDYKLQVVDNDDGTFTTWVEEADNPANQGMVYNVDITGATLYGDQVAVSGDYNPGLGGVDALFIVPEPATMGLLGLGALALIRRRRA